MPAIRKLVPRRGKELLHSPDPDDLKGVVEAVMSEVKSTRANGCDLEEFNLW